MNSLPRLPPPGTEPVRTCVGCRARAPRSALVRVVLEAPGASRAAVDDRASAPGRGAWLHADQQCLDLAVRRRAFPRALRSAGPVDLDAVHAWFTDRSDAVIEEESGLEADGHPMSTQR
ncbi:YlxR family protein [Georgenia faecalis]|uniref:YlxR family protein n=1 Tax=Georgenia faecalis TaxID=2483799 RepID=UPI000F08CAE1